MWFRVTLTDSISISSHPQEKDAAQHWSPIAFLLPKIIEKNKDVSLKHHLNELETQMECLLG
jgi:hypothetical protein